MPNIIIACRTLKYEVEYILRTIRTKYRCIWIDESLHYTPVLLNEEIQEKIDEITDCNKIMLIYGNCGGALSNLRATHCDLVLPKCDDCIQIMLHKKTDLNELRRTSYFCSIGWLWGKEGLGYEFDRMDKKYGRENAIRLLKIMYKNYKNLVYIETKNTKPFDPLPQSMQVADKLGLSFKKLQGDMGLIQDMLNGCEDERFKIIPTGEYFT